jgi:hypothetical protein
MNHLRIRVCVSLLLSLCALTCATNPSAGKKQPESDQASALSVEFSSKDAAKFKWGEVMPSLFILKNISDRAVVVLGIEPLTNSGEEPIALYGSAYGSVRKRDLEDIYEYDGLAQSATRLPFYSGFLLPGQELAAGCQYRPVEKRESFKIRYISSDGKYNRTPDSLKPLRIYIPDKMGREFGMTSTFRFFTESRWLEVSQGMSEAVRGFSARAVLIPDLNAVPREQKIEMSIQFKDEGFFLESAQKTAERIIGSRTKEMRMAYSYALGGYVVSEGDSCWLLANGEQKTRGSHLPQFPLMMLKDIDTRESIDIWIGEKQEGFGPGGKSAGWKFWDAYPVLYGDGMYTRGEFIRIDKTSLQKFLEQVRQKGGKLTETKYFFESRYFILELPGR